MALTDPATLSPVRPSEPSASGALGLSAAVICLNEAACIGKCLESLRDCAEIVVVDSGSSDGTLAIVEDFARRGFPIRLIHQPWLGYARQKQFALDLDDAAVDLQRRRGRVAGRRFAGLAAAPDGGRRVGRRLEGAPFAHALRAGEAGQPLDTARAHFAARAAGQGALRSRPHRARGPCRGPGRDADRARRACSGTSAACR